jgi:hypothetical protein
MSNCKGCTGSHGSGSCGCKNHDAETDDGWAISNDCVPSQPYESLYQRCHCKLVGLTPEVWKEYGPRICVRNGMHSIEACPPPENLPHEIKVICEVLGDRFPEVK